MKRKVINKNNKRLQNRFDLGGWEDTAKSIAMTNPYGAMAVGFDSLALGVSNKANEMFGGQAYDDNPDWINEGIYGDSSGTHIGKMWSKNKTLDETVDKIEDYGNQGFSSLTNEGLVNEYQNTDFLKESNISGLALDMSDVIDNLFDPGSSLLRGIAGIFGNRQKTARERQDEINDAIREANKRKIASFNSRIRQVLNRQKFSDMQNMFGFGGFFDSPYIGGAIEYDLAQKNLENKRIDALSKNKITALPATGSVESINMFAGGGGLSRSKDYGSKKKPYPSVKKGDFAGGGRSYPIPTKADAIDALRLAGLHNRPDVKAKVYKKYPSLKKHADGGYLDFDPFLTQRYPQTPESIGFWRMFNENQPYPRTLIDRTKAAMLEAKQIENARKLQEKNLQESSKLYRKMNQIDNDYLFNLFLHPTYEKGLRQPKGDTYEKRRSFAFGGDLNSNGSIFDLGYTNIGNGNTHEDNIYGGVPVSMDALGIPNLVEEGEVIWNDYVFSNRLKNPKTGRTFARDAKKAQQESKERPNDPISKRGLEVAYTKLANELEAIRQETATKKASSKAHKFAGDTEDGSTIETVDWSTYSPNGWWDVMRQSSILPGIYGLLNPPKAYSYKVPRAREVTYNPLGDALIYTPLDVDYRINQYRADAAATRRALANMGNPLSQASLLTADYNAQQGLGDLIRKAAEFDLQQRQGIGQFNLTRGRYNQEADLQADRYNQATDLEMAKLESDAQRYYQDQLDKVYGAKMDDLANIFGNLSNMGKDYRNRYDALWSARFLPGGLTIKG